MIAIGLLVTWHTIARDAATNSVMVQIVEQFEKLDGRLQRLEQRESWTHSCGCDPVAQSKLEDRVKRLEDAKPAPGPQPHPRPIGNPVGSPGVGSSK
jgi:hypothetical protein